jgi:hypothetical protein
MALKRAKQFCWLGILFRCAKTTYQIPINFLLCCIIHTRLTLGLKVARPTAAKPMTGPRARMIIKPFPPPRPDPPTTTPSAFSLAPAPAPAPARPPAAQAFPSPKTNSRPPPRPQKFLPFPPTALSHPMASPAKRAKASSPAKPPSAAAPDEAAAAASEDPVVLLRRRWELASVLNFLRVSLGFLPPRSIRGSHGPIRLFSARAECDSCSGCLGRRCLSR